MKITEINIDLRFISGITGDISATFEEDFGFVLPMEMSLPRSYAMRRYDYVSELHALSVAYLGLRRLDSIEDVSFCHMAEQDATDPEIRHLVAEIFSCWFPVPQPQLDEFLPLVTFVGGPWPNWMEKDLPRLASLLPAIQTE
ncbi:MAG: hypothetical protein RLZZ519_2578 [Bacteroidota bacterium]|jgi:hypothetical protein